MQPHPLYDAYDGRIRCYREWDQGDDLYILGSRQALVGLRRAVDAALSRQIARCTGLDSEDPTQPRLVTIILMDPYPDQLAEELQDKPTEIPSCAEPFTLFDRLATGCDT